MLSLSLSLSLYVYIYMFETMLAIKLFVEGCSPQELTMRACSLVDTPPSYLGHAEGQKTDDQFVHRLHVRGPGHGCRVWNLEGGGGAEMLTRGPTGAFVIPTIAGHI